MSISLIYFLLEKLTGSLISLAFISLQHSAVLSDVNTPFQGIDYTDGFPHIESDIGIDKELQFHRSWYNNCLILNLKGMLCSRSFH